MGLPSGSSLPGLSDASDAALSGVQQLAGGTVAATVEMRGVTFDVVRFTPTGARAPLLLLHAPKLGLGELMPAAAGTPIAALGTLDDVFLIYAPKDGPKTFTAPQGAAGDGSSAPPAVMAKLRQLAQSRMALAPGMNLAATLPLTGLPQELAELVRAVGLNPASRLPLQGAIGTAVFKQAFAKVPAPPRASLGNPQQIKTALANVARTYGPDFIAGLDLKADIPSTTSIGPFSATGEHFAVKGTSDGAISFGIAADELKAYDVDINDALFTYDADKRAVVAGGTVDTASLGRLVTYKGLSFEAVSLASTYARNAWGFALAGTAKLNGVDIAVAVTGEHAAGAAKPEITATLTAGQGGITAKDVAGRDVPGLDKIALTKVEVSGDRLVADLTFGARRIPGEIAAFHVGGQSPPTLAVTLDKLAFADLVPGSAGSPLDGVEVDDLTLLIVPPGAAALAPGDAAIPDHIKANLQKVLTAAAAHDPAKASHTLAAGFNLLAELDIKASQGVGTLMRSVGVGETVMPIVGTISAATFQPNAPKADSLKDLDLEVALPTLRLPGLPDSMQIANPRFAVSGVEPAALTAAAATIAKGQLQGPFVFIGAGLVLQAGQGKHEFDALLLTGKDAQGKRVVDLVGSAKDPKGLFEFKGLEVKTLDLASVYDAGAWDFKLNGTAALNSASLTFDTDIKKVDGKVVYEAVLDGGPNGISAEDVAGRHVPGLDKVALTKVTVAGSNLVADMVFGAKKTPGELAAFHAAGQTNATLAFSLDKLAFADLVPGSAGSALDGVEVAGMSLVIVPPGGELKPDDAAIPQHIADNLKKVLAAAATHDPAKASYALKAGFNVLADLDLKASQGMGNLMQSAGLTQTVVPVVGVVSAATFQPGAPKADSLKDLNLEAALPDLRVPGLPDTITIAKPMFSVTSVAPAALTAAASGLAKGELQAPFVTIGADLKMQAGAGTHEFDALLMVGKDAQGKRVVDLLGTAKDPKGLFQFKGLEVRTLDLASVYDAGKWDFKLDGAADLNAAQVTFATEIRKVDNKVEYVATLSGGATGISAKDVAGRDLPGFDKVALTTVTVTGEQLVADLTFGAKKTRGEVAAFHPAGADKPVMAFTLDTLAFADLVPGSAGSVLDGVEVDELTMVVVPSGLAELKPSDPAIPAHIAAGLAKVLADAAKTDPAKATYALKPGFNLLADLEIKGSRGVGALMASAGVAETVLPIVGTVSASTFQPSAPKKDSLAGLNLEIALPDLKVPGLPDTIKITKPLFAIADTAPPALTAAASGLAKGALEAPFVTIGAGLTMQAGGGTHEFDALLTTGKDAAGKQVVDLLGAAKDPKGLFEFKGLTVKTLDLASVYDAGNWDFKLDGSADLNGAAVTYETEIEKVDGKTTYVATLDGGKDGISAKNVAGRDVPGLDEVALTKVIVTGDSLTADMIYGPKKTAGEVAAFHPKGADHAVIAMTLDELAFSDLLPGAAGSSLDGVDVADLTLLVVPDASAGLKPDDASIPAHIQANVKKVLGDAGKADYALAKDINLFADLEIGGSTAMQDLMSFIGRDGKKPIAIVGAMSPKLFDAKAPKAERFKGMDLSVPMPDLELAGLPSSFAMKNTEFRIADAAAITTPGAKEGAAKGDGLWVGLQSDLDADLLGSKIAFRSDVGFGGGAISMSASSTDELKKPFGISWLDLKQLALALDYDKKTKTGDLKFTALPAEPFGKSRPEIEIELKEEGGKLTAGVLKIVDKVAFSDLPILKKIKHADQFDFTFLEISKDGVSGGSELHGQKVDVAVFDHAGGWNFAVSDNGGGKGFKFDRLVPPLSKTPLKDFHLNDAALIFAQAEISGKVSDLPEVAQAVFKDIYGNASAPMKLVNGITVAANFSPGSSGGFAAKGMQGIGIHDDILIEGAVVNIFGNGTPGVDILVQTAQGPGGSKGATHTPKMAKFPGQVGFFIQYQQDELDVGLEADVQLTVPKKEVLDLVTKLELELNEKGFAVDIFMDLKGQWKNPFGIHGLELDEVAFKFGIDMEDEAVFGFHGKTILADGAEKVDIAAEMDFELDALGLPDGVAMKGTVSDLGIPAVIDVAERLAGGKAKIVTDKQMPLPEFKNVTFAFATPGVSDPQLGLIGSGFMLRGEMLFLGRELGSVDMNAGTTGIHMDDQIAPIDFKILKLDKNRMKLDLGFKSLPKLEIDSEIEFLGAKQQVVADFKQGMMNIAFEDKIGGGIWDSQITMGIGVEAAHDAEPDVYIEGLVKSDFFAWLRNQAPAKVREFFNSLNADFEKAKAAITNAEQVVRGWNNKIAARKAEIQRERANADNALQQAENRVNSVRGDVNHAHDQAEYHKHHCHWYSAWHCAEEAYWWGRYGIEYAAYKVALGVLQAAKSTVDHLPSELMDPQLAALEGEQAAAMAALELAKSAIDGVEDADRWMDSGLEKLLADVGRSDALVVKEIFFEADLDGMLKGQPAILTMDLEIFGDDLGTQMFAFKLTDPGYDAEQLAFIPLHMTAELFQKFLPSSLHKLLGAVLSEINTQAADAARKAYQELKDTPGLDLPPELQQALQQSAALDLPADVMLASNAHGGVMDDAGGHAILLAQATPTAPEAPAPQAAPATPVTRDGPSQKTDGGKLKLKRDPNASLADRFKAYQEKKKALMLHIMERNKGLGESLVEFQNQQMQERAKNENDEFVAYTDVHVPPGELFTEHLLVARHSKLCLGQNAANKTTFHPCSENPGGLLWSTRQMLLDRTGKLIQYDETKAKKWPGRVYTQLLHNGLCLTTPFHLAAYDADSRKQHEEQLVAVAKGHPSAQDAHLSLQACRPDGKGQLWKVAKTTHDQDGVHGFKIQERDSAYCLRPGTVHAQTKKQSKEVNGVFYPCTGIAHGTFELVTPNADMPVWYDHNGVIKSDNGFCLDVPNDPSAAADTRGSVVFLKECEDDAYDRWDYVVDYDKTVKIVNDFTGYCLYPYDKAEGAITSAAAGQLVERPCDGRYGQNWKMRVIAKQKWFQLEALDSDKKGTNTCMVAEKRNPGDQQVEVFVKACDPQTRGRWEFGHWKGRYQWAEWTNSTAGPGGVEDLSSTYWVSADSLAVSNRNGVCRVIVGHQDSGQHAIYAGTWYGSKCGYFEPNGQITAVDPSQLSGSDTVVEVLTGLDIGVTGATASWKSSAGGIPTDPQGQNALPPAPRFSAFLVGGDVQTPATYLCRVKVSDTWHYGYQGTGSSCMTDAGRNARTDMQVLVFATVQNQNTGN